MSNKKHKRWLIHFSADDWWYHSNPHSRYHITMEFNRRGFHILWVNPMGLRFPKLRKKDFKSKIFNKFKSIAKCLQKESDSFFIYSFFFLPVFKKGFFEKLNNLLISWQMRYVLQRLKINKAICFATLPTFAPCITLLKSIGRISPIIYYYSDQYSLYREIKDRKAIIEWDQSLQEMADVIYCASEDIYKTIPEKYKKEKPVKLIEHQVDFDLFDYNKVTPQKLDLKWPIIGYFGSLTDSNDWDIIRYVAQRQPEWNFVFIGQKNIDLPDLEKMQNIHFIGYIPYTKLPAVAVNFSVGIMFWKMTEWIKACSPLKLKEYLALGLPVVSVPIDEIVIKYSQYVDIANDGPEFETAIANALNKHDHDKRNKFAGQFSWSYAVDEIIRDCNL